MENSNYKKLLLGMKEAYEHGENSMAWARAFLNNDSNTLDATLISYELQSGTYISEFKENKLLYESWWSQLHDIIKDSIKDFDSIMEVGVGEATTLFGILNLIKKQDLISFGFDISWSRLYFANKILKENGHQSNLFVADLFNIPLPDKSIDVVYTAHSLEPNGGKELEAIIELVRITSKRLILIEPSYEFADEECKLRMKKHGYVRDLIGVCNKLGLRIEKYELLAVQKSLSNPAAVIVINVENSQLRNIPNYICPISNTNIEKFENGLYSKDSGHYYPIVKEIPILLAQKGVMAFFLNRV